jgi:plastocyanin
MDFTQDRYGSELTWEVRDEVSNTLIASGGPYADLAATGILLHTVPFTVAPNKCYKVVVNDSYGDGFNSGYGAGKYQIIANPTVIYTMSGVMGPQDIKLFKTSATANGINEQNSNIANISVYPSPAKNAASLSLDLLQNESISVNVVNAIGQVVYTDALTNLSAGNHVVNFNTENWASGVYSINVSSTNGTSNIKLVVSK